jgi:5'-methylthioadenosine phosphorylase
MNDYYGFASFFSQIGRKPAQDPRETIVFNSGGGELNNPVTGRPMKPKFLGGIEPDVAGKDRREVLARWLASPDNPYFATNLANIVWAHFFGSGIVAHIAFAHPVCKDVGDVLEQSCKVAEVKAHRGGTYICMEGPAFSTVAESNVYRSWGMDVIGMTNLQEAKLAREAEICYATLALVTDYDCWHPGHDAVTVETVIEYLNKNVRNAQLIMKQAVKSLAQQPRSCKCGSALQNAIFTAPNLWPEATAGRLQAIIGKYQPKG